MHRMLFTAIAAPFCCSIALAEEAPPPAEEIVVVGLRAPTPIDQIGRSLTVITGAQIQERQQRFLADALEIAPGLNVTRSGTFGALANVSLRGLPASQTLVVVDGVVVNDPSTFGNSFDFGQFDTADIARIEVLRGAQATLYGSNAIGGVINVISADGRDGLGGGGYLEAGSFGTVRGAGTIQGGGEALSGRLTVAGTRSAGISSADVPGGERDGFRNYTVSGKASARPVRGLTLQSVLRFADSRTEFDDGAQRDNPANVTNGQSLSVAGFATHDALGGRLENQFSAAYFRNARNDASSFPFEGVGERLTLEYLGRAEPLSWARIGYGVEYERQSSAVALGFGGNDAIRNLSGYGFVELKPLPGVTLNAGARHDANSDFENATTFSVSGAIKVPVLGVLLRGSYAEGFRAPSVGELDFNPLLEPENSRGWDVSLSRGFFDALLQVQAAYFSAAITSQIGFDLSAFTFRNIDAYTTQGAEFTATVRPGEALELVASYTYTDALDVDGNFAALNQPDHRLSAQITWRPTAKLSLGAGVRWNSRETNSFGPIDAFSVLDLRAAYALTRAVEVFARVENATDTDYQDNFGFATPQASAYGGVRARF